MQLVDWPQCKERGNPLLGRLEHGDRGPHPHLGSS